jgi:AraC-like DNA-binding protein
MTIFESVKKGIAYIESNLQSTIGVSDVADAVSYSQFYFSREFTRHTHISVYDYILRRKVSEAYKCLFGTGSKIVDLAFRFGFQSHEVFTRAFRKTFGENPSEAVLYKPLAIFEVIDSRYLDFLYGLKTAFPDETACDCFFEPAGGLRGTEDCSVLMHLGAENLFDCRNVFRGVLTTDDSPHLSFRLCRMKTKLRIFHTDEALAIRYFFDHVYNDSEMGGNYVLARKGPGCIDILISQKAE